MTSWTKPLPKHTRLDYYECYAKIVLEELFPTEFVDLQIKDKPDLQMNNGEYGVEVTISQDKDQLKAESLYTDISYNRVRNIERATDEIEKCGCKLENGVLTGKSGVDSFDFILESFRDKLHKLNYKDYKIFKTNCLFAFSDIYANERMINEAIQIMRAEQKNNSKKFLRVIVLVPGYCYDLDLGNYDYAIYKIDSVKQMNQAYKARELVEKYQEK